MPKIAKHFGNQSIGLSQSWENYLTLGCLKVGSPQLTVFRGDFWICAVVPTLGFATKIPMCYINCNDERTKKRSELAHSKHWNFIKCNIVCENEGNAKMLKNLISLQGHDWVDLSGRCVVDCPSLIVLKKRSKSKGLAFSSFLFY